MGKKKHDSEASDSGVKKEDQLNRVPLPVDMARLIYRNWMSCHRCGDVHTCLTVAGSYLRVHVLPMPLREPEMTAEIGHRWKYLLPDLHADPTFIMNSDLWLTWHNTEKNLRRKAGFLGDQDYPFGPPPAPAPPRRKRQRGPPARPQDDDALAY
jgi:hypothetical protein